jgi:hypothetical protein
MVLAPVLHPITEDEFVGNLPIEHIYPTPIVVLDTQPRPQLLVRLVKV